MFSKWWNSNKQRKKTWPPTPQDFLNDTSMKNANLNNLIGWITDPNARFSSDGFVKYVKNKIFLKIFVKIKQFKLWKFVMKLWRLYQHYNQHLAKCHYPLILIIKPFQLMIYINWDMRYRTQKPGSLIQSTIIPSIIHKGISTTHVVDNVNWKNKDLSSPENCSNDQLFSQSVLVTMIFQENTINHLKQRKQLCLI